MKKILRALSVALMATVSLGASAQYYEIANQLPQLIRPALSGSLNYKGFLDASYLQGVGNTRANFLDFSTSQGFRYSNWFYMGVGIGADILFSNVDDGWGNGWQAPDDYVTHSSRTTAVMIPLFTDFRFNIGASQPTPGVSFFIDLRIGCSFLCSDDWIRINNGYLTNQEYFYLRPSMGIRIPVSSSGRQAIDIGVVYKLLTSNYWSSWTRNVTLNSLGATIAFEW